MDSFGLGIRAPSLGIGSAGGSRIVSTGPQPLFDLPLETSGYSILPDSITINSISASPTLIYDGKDASTSSWAPRVGTGTLSTAGSGADVVPNGVVNPFTTSADTALRTAGGKCFRAAASSVGDLGTEDFVLELVVKGSSIASTADYYVCKRTTSGAYWRVETNTSGALLFTAFDGTTTVTTSAGNLAGSWNVIHVCCDVSDTSATGLRVFANGVLLASSSQSGGTFSTLANSALLTIGAPTDAVAAVSSGTGIARIGIWKQANWFPGAATNATVTLAFAQERAAIVQGLKPSTYTGAWLPSTQVRNSNAYIDVVTGSARKLALVGNSWMRIASRLSATSATVAGYLAEPANTNLALHSGTLSASGWTQITGADTLTTTATGLDGELSARSLIPAADGVGVGHGVTQAITLTATTFTASVWAKAGSVNFLEIRNATIANGSAWFNLNTGAVGTTQAGVTSRIESYGDSWYRCSITFTGTVAAHTIHLRSASADATSTHTAAGGVAAIHLSLPQVEANAYPTSPIITVASSAARSADQLLYPATSNIVDADGTILLNVLARESQSSARLFGVSSSAANELYFGASSTALSLNCNSNGAVALTATTWTDNLPHTLRARFAANDLKLYKDAVQVGATDTTVTQNTGLTRLGPGSNSAASPGGQTGALISRVKVYSGAGP